MRERTEKILHIFSIKMFSLFGYINYFNLQENTLKRSKSSLLRHFFNAFLQKDIENAMGRENKIEERLNENDNRKNSYTQNQEMTFEITWAQNEDKKVLK